MRYTDLRRRIGESGDELEDVVGRSKSRHLVEIELHGSAIDGV